MNREECTATLELHGVRHVWCDTAHYTGYALLKDAVVYKPRYHLGRHGRRRSAEFEATPLGFGYAHQIEGGVGWRIDELRVAVKQILLGDEGEP